MIFKLHENRERNLISGLLLAKNLISGLLLMENLISGVLLIHPEFATLHCSQRTNEAVQSCVEPIAQYAKILNQEVS